MKHLINLGILTLFSIFYVGSSYGQNGTIKGSVVDDNLPVNGAAVQLRNKDSVELDGTYTDFDGRFELQAPQDSILHLSISFVGFEDKTIAPVQLKNNQDTLDIGEITLQGSAYTLDEVSLRAHKKLVSYKDGKTTVSVENSPIAQGGSTHSLLSQIPGVSLSQDGDIQLQGKSGVQVLVNGQKLHLKGDALKSYLEALPANTIKSVILNPNPSAEYDAEGSAGILEIELKKGEEDYFNGNIAAGYTYTKKHLWNTNVFLSNRNDRWDWSVMVDASKKGRVRDRTSYREYAEETPLDWMDQTEDEQQTQYPIQTALSANYAISENQEVGLNIELGRKKADWNWNGDNDIKYRNEDAPHNIQSYNQNQERFSHGIAQAFYKIKTDTLGSQLKVTGDGSLVKRAVDSDFKNLATDSSIADEHFQSPERTTYKIFSSQLDYTKVWQDDSELKVGSKFSRTGFDSNLDFYLINDNGEREKDPEQSSDFDYDEKVWAGYVDFKTKLFPKVTMQAGLRTEKTWNTGTENLLDETHKTNYLDWFPSIRIAHEISDNYTFEYGFSRRIERPSYDFLNPQIFYIDPLSYVKGDPGLKPQYANTLFFNQTIANKFRIGLSYEEIKDNLQEKPLIDEEGKTNFAVGNIKKFINYGLSAHAPVKIAHFWHTENALELHQHEYLLDDEAGETKKKQHYYGLFQNQNQIQLPKDFNLSLNFTVQSPMVLSYYEIERMWWIDLGLEKSFNDGKWELSLKLTDLLRTRKMKVDYSFNENTQNIRQYFNDQSFGIQLRYNFGGTEEKEQERAEMEEFERIEQK